MNPLQGIFMEQMIEDGEIVEVAIRKVLKPANGSLQVRILDTRNKVLPNSRTFHLDERDEVAMDQKLQLFSKDNFDSLPKVDIQSLVEGQLVLCRQRKTNTYHRGYLKKPSQSSSKKHYMIKSIDTGQVKITDKIEDIKLLPPNFSQDRWPPNILHLSLAKVEPLFPRDSNDVPKWSDNAIDYITKCKREAVVFARVTGFNKANGCYFVDLFTKTTATSEAECINKNLVAMNLAVPTDASLATGNSAQNRSSSSLLNKAPNSESPSLHNNQTSSLSSVRSDTLPSNADKVSPYAPISEEQFAYCRDLREEKLPSNRNSTNRRRKEEGEHTKKEVSDPPRKVIPKTRKPNISPMSHTTEAQGVLQYGTNLLSEASSLKECNLDEKIRDILKSVWRGNTNNECNLPTNLSFIWPCFREHRDFTYVHRFSSKRELYQSFLMPIMSTIAKGSFGSLPKTHSPKSVVVVPSCRVADDIYGTCFSYIGHVKSLKYAIHVRRAYNITNYSPHVELWDPTDILIVTPAALLHRIEATANSSQYFVNTCYFVVVNLDELMRLQRTTMVKLFSKLKSDLQHRQNSRRCQIALYSDLYIPQISSLSSLMLTDPLLFIQSRMDAALYCGVQSVVVEDKTENDKIVTLLAVCSKSLQEHRKVVVFVRSNEISKQIIDEFSKEGINFTTQSAWKENSILVISDEDEITGDSVGVVVTDIVHYNIPSTTTSFNRRLSYFTHLFHSKNKTESEYRSIFLLVDSDSDEVVCNVVQYLRRYGNTISDSLAERAVKGELEKQHKRIKQDLCRNLKQYGDCEERGCSFRHVVLKEDKPCTDLKLLDIPLSGKIKVKISAVSDGNRLFGHIISLCDNEDHDTVVNGVEQFNNYQRQLQQLLKDGHKRPYKEDLMKELESIVAVKDPHDGQYYRALVLQKGEDNEVKVRYVDTGHETEVPYNTVFKLPDRMSRHKCLVVELIVCQIKPADEDVRFSRFCMAKLRKSVVGEVMEGRIILALGNTLWVRTLEKRVYLKSIRTLSSELSIRKLILDDKLGVDNPDHIRKLAVHVKKALPNEMEGVDGLQEVAHVTNTLEANFQYSVYISYLHSPDHFYVNLVDNIDSLVELCDRINDKNVLEGLTPTWLSANSYCLARYPEDQMWYRGQIRKTHLDKYHVYFVDYGNENKSIPSNFVKPIPAEFLELPFQAVECTLSGISALTGIWTSRQIAIFNKFTSNKNLEMNVVAKDGMRVKGVFYTEQQPLSQLLARSLICYEDSIQETLFSEYLVKMYTQKGSEVESVAEDFRQELDRIKVGDEDVPVVFAALCRLLKIHVENVEVSQYLLSSLFFLLSNHQELTETLMEEDCIKTVVDKLKLSPSLHVDALKILEMISTNKRVKQEIADVGGVDIFCNLCVYKSQQVEKLLLLIRILIRLCSRPAPQTSQQVPTTPPPSLTATSEERLIAKQIRQNGHIRTLCKLLSNLTAKEEVSLLIILVARIMELDGAPATAAFREEGGLRFLCRKQQLENITEPLLLVDILSRFTTKEDYIIMCGSDVVNKLKLLCKQHRLIKLKMQTEELVKQIKENQPEVEEEIPENNVLVQMPQPIILPLDKDPKQKSDIKETPHLLWHQTKDRVGISVQLKDVKIPSISLDGNTLKFATWNYGKYYEFEYELFGGVKSFTETIRRSEVLIYCEKDPVVTWTSLVKAPHAHPNIKLDFSRANEDSSDSETEDPFDHYIPYSQNPIYKNMEVLMPGEEDEDDLSGDEEEGYEMGYHARAHQHYDSDNELEALE